MNLTAKFQVGQWRVDADLNSLYLNGSTFHLEPKVMQVLLCLASQPGEVISKDVILNTVWPETFVSDDVLTRSISELRRTFEDDAREPRFIQTIPKRGYRLVATVERVNGSAQLLSSPQHSSSSVIVAGDNNETHAGDRRKSWALVGASAVSLLAIGWLLYLNAGRLRDRFLGNRNPSIRSIAVLPLQSLSDDPKQEYFAEGVTDALITDLAQINALKVVSRTTITRYGKPDKPLPQIARQLNVDGIVEGTVQRSGDRVRVTAQLIYGPADQHLWASSFERDVKDILQLQNAIAGEIVDQIKIKVTAEEQARLKNPRPVNPKALDAYIEARYHIDQCQNLAYYRDKTQAILEEAREAISFLDEAVREDPNYLPAYVAYFDVIDHVDVPLQGYSSRVHAALSKALELDETNVPAHLALAKLLMEYDYNWAGAEKEYKRAIEIDPRSADAHAAYAEYLDNVEGVLNNATDIDTEDAKRERGLAQALDPAHDYYADAGQQRIGRTLDEQRQAVERKAPNDPFSLAVMGKNYAIAGRFKESVEMYERSLTLYGWHDMATAMKRANARHGPRYALEEWMRAGEEYEKKHRDMPVVPMAFTYASLGNRDQAFAWLDKAVEQRNWMIIYLKRDEVWAPLRSDPRFGALLQRVGLPQ